MIPLRALTVSVALSTLTSLSFAQEEPPISIGVSHESVTIITLGSPSPVWNVLPFGQPEPVSVTPGTNLQFHIGFPVVSGSSVQWLKNGDVVATTPETFEISRATIADSGSYSANISINGGTASTASVVVRVTPPVHQQFIGLASRTTIDPSNPILIGGFVVAPGSNTGVGKPVLIRAVGPGLASVGVPKPLAAPKLKLFKSDGSDWDDQGHAAVWPFGPLGYPDLSRIAGTFPLISGAGDVVRAFILPPGAYTTHVSSADSSSGDVLLEIYELPESVIAAPWTHVLHPPPVEPPHPPSGSVQTSAPGPVGSVAASPPIAPVPPPSDIIVMPSGNGL